MSPTKVLTINPEFFSNKHNNSKTLKKERKQKPIGVKTTSANSMRKTLLAKIRNYQKKEEDTQKSEKKINEEKEKELDDSFESEFNKSLNFLQEIANKHKSKEKNKTFKNRSEQKEQYVNLELPEALVEIPNNYEERNSENKHTNFNKELKINNEINKNHFNNLPNTFPIALSIKNESNIIDNDINIKPLIKIQPHSLQPHSLQPHSLQPHSLQPPPIITINTPQMSLPTIQETTKPLIPLQIAELNKPIETNKLENIKMQISHIDSEKNINHTIKPKKLNDIVTPHNLTLKNPPPYSNLKGSNKPTYREWNKTYKTHGETTGKPRITINENNNKKYLPTKKLITRKTKTIKYNLGKKGKTVGILIKNNKTRKKIKHELLSLKKKSIIEVKDYLHQKNLIKSGTLAPNDVLREIYEQSILSGDVVNESNQNLIHNFLNNKKDIF